MAGWVELQGYLSELIVLIVIFVTNEPNSQQSDAFVIIIICWSRLSPKINQSLLLLCQVLQLFRTDTLEEDFTGILSSLCLILAYLRLVKRRLFLFTLTDLDLS